MPPPSLVVSALVIVIPLIDAVTPGSTVTRVPGDAVPLRVVVLAPAPIRVRCSANSIRSRYVPPATVTAPPVVALVMAAMIVRHGEPAVVQLLVSLPPPVTGAAKVLMADTAIGLFEAVRLG